MKSGGDQEFELATIPHLNALFQTALQLTEDRAVAEELLHEVCDCAAKSFARRADRANWRCVLFKILIERARRRATTGTAPVALSGIPRAEREILLLVDCHDFSYQQAADILGFSWEAVAQGVSLGRTRLETALHDHSEVIQ